MKKGNTQMEEQMLTYDARMFKDTFEKVLFALHASGNPINIS